MAETIQLTQESLFAKVGRLQMEVEARIAREEEFVKMIQALKIQLNNANTESVPPAKVDRSTRK